MTSSAKSEILNVKIEEICQEDPNEEILLGVCTILGAKHHAQFIRVHWVDGKQGPVCDPHDRYEEMQALHDGEYFTMKVPGFDGDYVLLIHPFAL